ncbi:MAG TPA: ABC transporter ATP-binding protein [Polyangiaceae bacterium]|nr:ABC transporter ATP-binding protein [Polyangiaceae bacterium]
MTLGVAGYSAGHAALAVAAGSLAAALGKSWVALPSFVRLGNSIAAASYVGLVAALVKAASGALMAGSERLLGARVAARFRTGLLRRLLRNGPNLPAPRALAQLSVRLREIEASVSAGVLTGTRAAVQLVPLAACLVAISPSLTAFALLAVTPFAVAVAALRGRARRQSEALQHELEVLECGLDELVSHADLFRAYGAGERVVRAVENAGIRAGTSAARVDVGRALLSGGNEVMAALAIVVGVAVCTHLGLLDTAAALLPFSAIVFMAYRPLRDLGDARAWVMRGNVALAALRPPGATEEFVDDSPAPAPGPAPRLELFDVGAADRGPTTRLTADSGEIVCVVGPTGIGKTTLFRVLLGFEKGRGRITLDGADLSRVPSGPTSRPFAWVPQDAPLVTGSVKDNVLLVGGDERDVDAALELIGAEALSALPKDAVIGPGGRPLSGGQRRQVALCRALVSGLPVLLLDEPTEGLDAAAAASVCQAIANLRGTRTVLVATHREDVVRIADRVVHIGASAVDASAAE